MHDLLNAGFTQNFEIIYFNAQRRKSEADFVTGDLEPYRSFSVVTATFTVCKMPSPVGKVDFGLLHIQKIPSTRNRRLFFCAGTDDAWIFKHHGNVLRADPRQVRYPSAKTELATTSAWLLCSSADCATVSSTPCERKQRQHASW
jgi:hypothetical protein